MEYGSDNRRIERNIDRFPADQTSKENGYEAGHVQTEKFDDFFRLTVPKPDVVLSWPCPALRSPPVIPVARARGEAPELRSYWS